MRYFGLIFAVCLILTSRVNFAQETTVQLPTNDNTSSFNVTKNDDSTVLRVGAEGKIGVRKSDPATALDVDGTVTALQFKGDGSQLENVKPIGAGVQGYNHKALTSNIEIVRQVSITVPAKGTIFVFASGTADWAGLNDDVFRFQIDNNANLLDFSYNYVGLATDLECADSSDQYSPFFAQRYFNVSSAGTYTYYFYADNPTWAAGFSNSKVELRRVNMFAMYFPTGSSAVAEPVVDLNIESATPAGKPADDFLLLGNSESEEEQSPGKRIEALENELAAIKKQLKLLVEKVQIE